MYLPDYKNFVRFFFLVWTIHLVIQLGMTTSAHDLGTVIPITSKTPSKNLKIYGCPDHLELIPCSCTMQNIYIDSTNSESNIGLDPDFLTKPRIFCLGPDVDQAKIDKVFHEFRKLQAIPYSKIELNLDSFFISRTNLTELNLAKLSGTNFGLVNVSHNPRLKSIFFDSPNSNGTAQTFLENIRTERLILSWNNVTNSGLENLLLNLDPSKLIELDLSHNKINGGYFESTKDGKENQTKLEFLRHLNRFYRLQYLYLQSNQISQIVGGPFKSLWRLQELNLAHNEMDFIGEDAFLFQPMRRTRLADLDGAETRHISINLIGNQLADDKIHPDWRGTREFHDNRSMHLKLEGNNFEFISAQKFQKFFQDSRRNVINFCSFGYCLVENNLRCDKRMRWLKTNSTFERQIDGIFCGNDLPRNVFDSEKTGDEPLTFNSTCPDPTLIHPCICQSGHLSVTCQGSEVNQETIEKVMKEIQKVHLEQLKEAPPGGSYFTPLQRFHIHQTRLTSLDLVPCLGHSIEKLVIEKNENLSKIHFGGKFKNADEKIWVEQLHMRWNQLTDEGLKDTFSHFDENSLTVLDLTGNKIQGTSPNGELTPMNTSLGNELLPNLSLFENLKFLRLRSNKIEKIVGGQFENYSRLLELDLSENKMKELGKNALRIKRTEKDPENEVLHISFYDNLLKDNSIDNDNGMESLKRSTKISFYKNQFEFISQEKFKKFLYTNLENELRFDRNPLKCDMRMRWLKEARRDLEWRVRSMYCSPNNAFETVFNTKSIP